MSSKKRMPSTQSRKVQVSKQLNNLPEDDQAEIVEEGLKRLPRDERREIVQESMSYSGPIPHYSDFKGYESVLPGSADRILKMSENQSSHRQTIEKAVVLSEVENSKRGQRYAFVITLVALVFGFILLLFDKKLEGFVTLISTAVGLVGIFVYTKESEKEERKEKSKDE